MSPHKSSKLVLKKWEGSERFDSSTVYQINPNLRIDSAARKTHSIGFLPGVLIARLPEFGYGSVCKTDICRFKSDTVLQTFNFLVNMLKYHLTDMFLFDNIIKWGFKMATKQLTKRRRGKGRPLKEESNAIQLEKNILDLKTNLIAMIPEAHQVLRDLMKNVNTKDNIRENIARYVIEKGEQMLSDYFDEENEELLEKDNSEKAPIKAAKPFSTDIVQFKQG